MSWLLLAVAVAARVSMQIGMYVRRKMKNVQNPPRRKISASDRRRLYGLQGGKCVGCRHDFQLRNLEVDHIHPRSKGGTDDFENLQLLCGHCNRVKGNRTQEYLEGKRMGSEVETSKSR